MNNAHPIYSVLNGRNAVNDPAAAMRNEFERFKQSFTGDPQQEIMRLLQSGQVSQRELNEAQQMRNRFANLFK